MTPDVFLNELEQSLKSYRFDDVPALIEKIDPSGFSNEQIKRTLNLLRRKRLFQHVEQVAGLFSLLGKKDPTIKRQWSQALLDQNRVSQALVALEAMRPDVDSHEKEGPEIRGLIGRAYKQRFVNEGTPSDLPKAIAAYRSDWHADNKANRWHGINLVALMKRAERDGIDPQCEDNADAISKQIMNDIEDLDRPYLWDCGTAMEAAIALDNPNEALRWAKSYATDAGTDAFELGSTLRQLKEIWTLDEGDPSGSIIPILEYELLQREGGSIELGSACANTEGFEAVYGNEGITNLCWLESLFERAESIARIEDKVSGKRLGTGFLLAGSQLCRDWPDAPVFITNSHVVSDHPADEPAIRPGEGIAEFTRQDGKPRIELDELIATCPRIDLDFSIFKIKSTADTEPLVLTKYRPSVPGDDETQRIYVMGHPGGEELSVSLYDNNLASYEEPYVHYHSPTKGGNSGSPVFNRRLDTFAIHHRARDELQLNEGVLLESVKVNLNL